MSNDNCNFFYYLKHDFINVVILHILLVIYNTGSIFELTSGAPKLGFAVTASIALLGFPSFVFLFYAALLKGAAETEEDDKEFRKSDGFY